MMMINYSRRTNLLQYLRKLWICIPAFSASISPNPVLEIHHTINKASTLSFVSSSIFYKTQIKTFLKKKSEAAQSCPTLCNPWTEAYQAPLSLGFSRQEYWSGLLFPSPGDLPGPVSTSWQADSLPTQPLEKPCNKH